jgi:septum formation protein
VLRGAGIEPEVVVSGVDEDATGLGTTPEIVVELARRKARAVAAGIRDALVIGCDSLLDLDGEAIGKPGDEAAARILWRRLQARPATLHTGQVVIDTSTGTESTRHSASTIFFAALDDSEVEDYLRTGEPFAVAGGFTLDGRGGAFVSRVEGDPNGVLGLSTALLREQFEELGYRLSAIWRS